MTDRSQSSVSSCSQVDFSVSPALLRLLVKRNVKSMSISGMKMYPECRREQDRSEECGSQNRHCDTVSGAVTVRVSQRYGLGLNDNYRTAKIEERAIVKLIVKERV